MKWILETERLKLREFELDDAVKMWELNEGIDVIKYTGDPAFDSIEAARQFIEAYDHYEKEGFGRWAVILKTSGEFIGWCGLKRHEGGMVDIGFRFFKRDWGKGYATESAKACLSYGFTKLGMNEIIGRAAKANVASVRVLEKIGMQYWKEDGCEGIEGAEWWRLSN